MKLNLGCGNDIRKGYINIDVIANPGVDKVCDITQKLNFSDASIEEIVAQDILEHLTREQLESTLAEISRILKINGVVKIRIPNIDAIFDKFSNDHDTRNLFLYGDTSQTGVWGAHKVGLTSKTIKILCRLYNLEMINETSVDTNLEFEFIKTNKDVKIKKVLFINQTLGIGGAETFNKGLFNWLKGQNIKIKSYTTNERFNKKLDSAQKIPVVLDIIGNWRGLLKSFVLFPYALIIYLVIFLKSLNCDVIFMTGFVEKIIITPIAKLLNKPVVWVEFGPLESVFKKFFGLPKFLYRLVSKLPDAVIMPTQHTYRSNSAITQIPAAKVRIIPCAIEVQRNKGTKVQRDLVVCVSRLEKGKGQDLLIEAWPRVLEKFPTAKLKIIGEGSIKLNKCKNVEVVGYVKDATAEIAKAKVLVFPSVWPLEGFGLVMIEAMSLGVPVVAFNRGTAPEIIDEQSGILVDDLAVGIIKMLEHPVTGGVKRFKENYSFDIIGPKYLNVFKYAVAAHQTI